MQRFQLSKRFNRYTPTEVKKPLSINTNFLRPEKWLIVILILGLIYFAHAIMAPFIIAGVLAYILSPLIDIGERRLKLPRILVVGIFYLLFFGIAGGIIYGLHADISNEIQNFSDNWVKILQNALDKIGLGAAGTFGIQLDASTVINKGKEFATNGSGEALTIAKVATTFLLNSLLCLLALFYLLVDGSRLGAYILRFIPAEREESVKEIAGRIHLMLGAYLRGQFSLILGMILVSFLILKFGFHLNYALPLGILTGFLEIIPLLGPAVAAGMAASVALFQYDGNTALYILATYFVIRQLEDQIIMPMIVGRAVDVHPLVTILAVLVGNEVGGILGMLLAIPTAAGLKVILDYAYPARDKEGEEKPEETTPKESSKQAKLELTEIEDSRAKA